MGNDLTDKKINLSISIGELNVILNALIHVKKRWKDENRADMVEFYNVIIQNLENQFFSQILN
jgi:hypothetical protein